LGALMKLKLAPTTSAGHWLKLVTLAVMGAAQAVSTAVSRSTVHLLIRRNKSSVIFMAFGQVLWVFVPLTRDWSSKVE
jgi:hypothetical protein